MWCVAYLKTPPFSWLFPCTCRYQTHRPCSTAEGGVVLGPPHELPITTGHSNVQAHGGYMGGQSSWKSGGHYFPQSQKTKKIRLPTHSPKQGSRPAHSEKVLMDPQAWQRPRREALRSPWCAGPLAGRKTAPEKGFFLLTYRCGLSHSLGTPRHGAVF